MYSINRLENVRQILDAYYDRFSSKYLWTSMLSIPHMYKENIDNNPDNLGAITFISVLYDFQMKVSVIIERFSYFLQLLIKYKAKINELAEEPKLLENIIRDLRKTYSSFHRFDPKGDLLKILLNAYYDIDWKKLLENCHTYYDICVVQQLRKILDEKLRASSSYYRELVARFIPKRKESPNKRINLFLRWTVRDEYPDLGIFAKCAEKSRLIIPIGLEISRTAGRVFFGKELRATRKNAINITKILRMINNEDPIKYDFILSRPAILGLCNKDIHVSFCEICPLKDICIKYNKYMENKAADSITLIEDKITKYHASLKKKHDLSLKMIMNVISEYKEKYGFECLFDKPIGKDLRPDIFCNYSSDIIMIGEAKTSVRIKTAPLQLLVYYKELSQRAPGKQFIGIMIFGDYDRIEVDHILEIIELLGLDKLFNYIEIIAYDKSKDKILKISA